MSVFDHNDFAKREAKWEKLNVEHGGRFQTRVRELLALPVALTMIEARIKTLAEEGWNDGKIAERLGIKEKTVYNHSSKIRKLAGVGREVPFRMVFFPPPPPGEWFRRKRRRLRMKKNLKKSIAGYFREFSGIFQGKIREINFKNTS